MKPSVGLRVVNVIGALLFALFAWVQHNDIDPEIYYHPSAIDAWLWLLFYALIAACFVMAVFRPVPRWLLTVAAIAAIVFMARSGPGLWENVFGDQDFTMTQVSMSAEDPRVELSREFFGGLIAFASVAFLFWQGRRRPAATE